MGRKIHEGSIDSVLVLVQSINGVRRSGAIVHGQQKEQVALDRLFEMAQRTMQETGIKNDNLACLWQNSHFGEVPQDVSGT